jgi:hypothetical protein
MPLLHICGMHARPKASKHSTPPAILGRLERYIARPVTPLACLTIYGTMPDTRIAARRLGNENRQSVFRDEGTTMLELSRIVTAAGWTAFGVGFTVYGIGVAVDGAGIWEANLGLIMTIVGIIAGIAGMVVHHQLQED